MLRNFFGLKIAAIKRGVAHESAPALIDYQTTDNCRNTIWIRPNFDFMNNSKIDQLIFLMKGRKRRWWCREKERKPNWEYRIFFVRKKLGEKRKEIFLKFHILKAKYKVASVAF